jgi:hypothetical protein
MDTRGSIFTDAFVSGDDIPLNVQFYQSDNITPKDMTGSTAGITVKSDVTDQNKDPVPDSEALFQQDLVGNSSGLFPFLIPGQTAGAAMLSPGAYWLDLKLWDSANKRTTMFTTRLPIDESVTQRVTPNP